MQTPAENNQDDTEKTFYESESQPSLDPGKGRRKTIKKIAYTAPVLVSLAFNKQALASGFGSKPEE